MDPAVAWFQEEQNGPAKRTWLAIWDTMQEIDYEQQQLAANSDGNSINNIIDGSNPKTAKEMNILLDRGNNNNSASAINDRSTYYNPSRRKATLTQQDTNRASTFNMNKYEFRLVGKYGGCPWRPINYKYGQGVLG